MTAGRQSSRPKTSSLFSEKGSFALVCFGVWFLCCQKCLFTMILTGNTDEDDWTMIFFVIYNMAVVSVLWEMVCHWFCAYLPGRDVTWCYMPAIICQYTVRKTTKCKFRRRRGWIGSQNHYQRRSIRNASARYAIRLISYTLVDLSVSGSRFSFRDIAWQNKKVDLVCCHACWNILNRISKQSVFFFFTPVHIK